MYYHNLSFLISDPSEKKKYEIQVSSLKQLGVKDLESS